MLLAETAGIARQPEGGKIIVQDQEEEARKGQVAEEFVGGG